MSATILIIEDNPANLALVQYLLMKAGHQTHSAMDGEAGVRAAAQTRPDLIICDLQLPGLNGYEVLARLRSDPTTSRTPVIAVTAFSMPSDQEQVMTAGFDSYLSKPIEPETFVAQIERHLAPALRGAQRGGS